MSKPSIRRAATLLLRLTTPEQKAARLELLTRQWGQAYAEQVAIKADALQKKRRLT